MIMENKKPPEGSKISVFYDGTCGLCAKEINHYKKIAPNNIFEWIDITEDLVLFEALGYTQKDGLMALHAYDHNKVMHKGVEAFIVIWAQLKRWNLLAHFVSIIRIRQIANFVYKHFAKWRFKKMGYATCPINKG
jgi:predicted DCC family thiol-disulfide oxidoreductase YuxK